MAYNKTGGGGDVLQCGLELIEEMYEREKNPSPPAPIPIMEDERQLTYRKIDPSDPSFQYPSNIDVGDSRIGVLNQVLHEQYVSVAKLITDHARSQEILNANRKRVHDYQIESLESSVDFDKTSLDEKISKIIDIIGEIDAIAGKESYYVPAPIQEDLQMPQESYRVASGSLKHLAEKPNYISEKFDVHDKDMKRHLEEMAFCVNRFNYFAACGVNGMPITGYKRMLRELCDKMRFSDMPSILYEEVFRILSDGDKEEEQRLQRRRKREEEEFEAEERAAARKRELEEEVGMTVEEWYHRCLHR